MTTLAEVLDGGCYFEGPRWHAGRLWFVDCMDKTLRPRVLAPFDPSETEVAPLSNQESSLLKPLRLPEQCRLGRNRRPKLPDLNASCPNIPEPDGVVRRWPDLFAKSNVCDKTQASVDDAETSLLGLQKKLLHRHHVASHLAPNFTPSHSRFEPLASSGIGSLGHPKDTSSNPVPTAPSTHKEIGAN
jgi:hypothetical protein